MAYALPVVGGWLGDRVLGSRRAMLLGATCMMAVMPRWRWRRFMSG
jgi:dipeptide/tripeptide permease